MFSNNNGYNRNNKQLLLLNNSNENYEKEKKYFLTHGNVKLFKGHITEEFYFNVHDKLFFNKPIEPYKWKQEELEFKVNNFIENRGKLYSISWKDLDTKERLEDFLKLYHILYNKTITKPLIDSLTELQLYLKNESNRILDVLKDIDNFYDSFVTRKPYIPSKKTTLKKKNLEKIKKLYINKGRLLLDFFDPLENTYSLHSNIDGNTGGKEEEIKEHIRKIKLTKTELAVRIDYDDLLSRQIEVTLLLNNISKLSNIDTYNYRFLYIYALFKTRKYILLIFFYYILLLIPFIFSIVNIIITILDTVF